MKSLISIILIVLTFETFKAQTNSIPVTITKEDGNTVLQWNTQKEVNSSYFMIESSSDNQNFTPIGRIKAAGYSLINNTYELVCYNKETLKTYIRVTLVTMDGTRESTLVLNQNSGSPEDFAVRERFVCAAFIEAYFNLMFYF